MVLAPCVEVFKVVVKKKTSHSTIFGVNAPHIAASPYRSPRLHVLINKC